VRRKKVRSSEKKSAGNLDGRKKEKREKGAKNLRGRKRKDPSLWEKET